MRSELMCKKGPGGVPLLKQLNLVNCLGLGFGRRRAILVAIVLNETHGLWCVKQMQGHAAELMMSTVNYAEVLILISDRQPQLAP